MIYFDFNNNCTGCEACGDVCPQECISFFEDRDGFLMPHVDVSKCINCHKCERICPAINNVAHEYIGRKCYVAYNKDEHIRYLGSSGSIFYSLAESIIRKGGVVYASELGSDLQLRHTRATSIGGVVRQMKSKYIQSNIAGCYKRILSDLNALKDVLFVGTPCQCKALHNLVPEKLRGQLLIVDFVCHGVPSQSLFNKSISHFEEENSCVVNYFSFREKSSDSLRNYKIEFTTNDGKIHSQVGMPEDWPFYFGYFYHYIQRNSCFNCKMRGINRDSDITLGDFWGIDNLIANFNDVSKGYSMLVTNSLKGQISLGKLDNCQLVEVEKGLEYCLERNNAYAKKDKKRVMRSLFFWLLRHKGYGSCEKHFLTNSTSLLDKSWKKIIHLYDEIVS